MFTLFFIKGSSGYTISAQTCFHFPGAKNMLEKYWAIDIKYNVMYFSKEVRRNYKIKIINGRICYMDGERISSKEGRQLLFVLAPNREIYMLHREPESSNCYIKYCHSTILAGQKVASAGRVLDMRDGLLYKVDSNTGHYTVKLDLYIQFIDELLRRGYKFNKTKFEDYMHKQWKFEITTKENGFIEVIDLVGSHA